MTAPRITDERVEKAAHAMYADVEVGEWEFGELETLLAYRRAARVALEAAPAVVDREALIQLIESTTREHLWDKVPGSADEDFEFEPIAPKVADAVLALVNGGAS